ncbi:uncharacterized protein PV07_02291 [Cladophialophora immunda]|uniref:GST N-terminal domain-containing protein n=1 Tax=Cladophialophora immunda TaxID=569365 RepID=A0A0D2DIU8_9EURO|nr:uncharacterized protein PV07_02291 [Cladophialophora immunda]KIW35604.1 hypothetical protein PV07_02291 [Cladophialophora immunda]OQV04763.1 Glutathione S-transferase, domain-containing protein [Cladophialophora immunda]
MSNEVILYDLPSKGGFCWSLNPWKTRLVLNYKGIPYKTEWVEYPDLKPTFTKFGLPPNSSGPYEYTSPAIRLPSGEYLMESRAIVDKLEQLHPSPPLSLDSPYLARAEQLVPKLANAVRPIFMPLVPKTFLNPPSRDYFVASREKALGMPLDAYAAANTAQAWEDAKPVVKEAGAVYAENPDGPFLLGKQVSYADFMVLGFLRMMDRLGIKDRFFAMEGGEKLKELYEAGAKWLERDSY